VAPGMERDYHTVLINVLTPPTDKARRIGIELEGHSMTQDLDDGRQMTPTNRVGGSD
jgi:hypothetical protein